VRVPQGKKVALTPTPGATAEYYLWLGKQMHGLDQPGAAEEAWKKAVEANPKDIESRLQLAALMAVQFRYSEAREQLRAVLRRVPKEERALRLRRTMDHLEGRKR
jgi:thioredoxin-like negative regulator of GroEL